MFLRVGGSYGVGQILMYVCDIKIVNYVLQIFNINILTHLLPGNNICICTYI